MGWRCYLEAKKNKDTVLISCSKYDIPKDWLKLVSPEDYKSDCKIKHVMNPRFEVSGDLVLSKAHCFSKEMEGYFYFNIVKNVDVGDTLILTFGEVVDNPDYINPVSVDYYLNEVRAYDDQYKTYIKFKMEDKTDERRIAAY